VSKEYPWGVQSTAIQYAPSSKYRFFSTIRVSPDAFTTPDSVPRLAGFASWIKSREEGIHAEADEDQTLPLKNMRVTGRASNPATIDMRTSHRESTTEMGADGNEEA
jgi:hypothetical protein